MPHLTRTIGLTIILLGMMTSLSSKELEVRFRVTDGQQVLSMSDRIGDEKLELSMLRFYVSDPELYHRGRLVHRSTIRYYLVDMQEMQTSEFTLGQLPEDLQFDSLAFSVGIDSTTHALGVGGDALDPMHGMYWTWQTGYIFIKIEGTAAKSPARNQQFQFHIGGYQQPYTALCNTGVRVATEQDLQVYLDMGSFFSQLDLSRTYQIMRPCDEAVQIAQLFGSIFYSHADEVD